MKEWRLITEGKGDGIYNMIADEVLLAKYYESGSPTLRIYGWKKPFITLGYSQKFDNVISRDCSVTAVKRISGGAALLHDKEITYSLVCSRDDLSLPSSVRSSYRKICSFLKVFYSKLGLKPEFAVDLLSYASEGLTLKPDACKDFCFCGWQNFDLLIEGKKIGGNAQRRRRKIIFQHGSIPQSIDFERLRESFTDCGQLPGNFTDLDTLLGKKTDFWQLSAVLSKSFEEAFNVELKKSNFNHSEDSAIKKIFRERYYDSNRFRLPSQSPAQKTLLAG